MRLIRAALIAVVAMSGLSGAAEAQTRYFAREILAKGASSESSTTPPPTIYNTYSTSPTHTNTRNVNGCSFGNAGYKRDFKTHAEALQHCATVKGEQSTYLYCYVSTLGDESKQASVYSSACAPTWTGGSTAYRSGDGWYSMQAIASAYAK
jgi:hypothetical protein